MNTIDDLLTNIVNHNFSEAEKLIPHRDAKVLKNIVRLMNEPTYITENQSKLLIKILKEHRDKFSSHSSLLDKFVENPSWSRNFRVIEVSRRVFVTDTLEIPQIAIEATFSAEIRKIMADLNKHVTSLVSISPGKSYLLDLTEKNIEAVVRLLGPLKFTFSDDIKDYYNTIKSWSKSEFEDQYRITTISHPNFEKHIVADLGIETAIDQNIIADRSNRYRYFVENSEKNPENLTEIIAHREQTKIWISKHDYSLDDIFKSIIDLRRLPTLVVFDSRDSKKCLETLKKLSESLEKTGIFDGVGIYFRLDNDAYGKEFNQTIAEKHYNCHLDHNTKIVGVQNGKIPKFLLKTDWKPMSVISIDHQLHHSKTAVYAKCCDLVITYTDSQPIFDPRSVWE